MAGSSIMDRRFGFGPSWICGGLVNVFLWPNCLCFVDLRFLQTGSATILVTKAWRYKPQSCRLGVVA